MIIPRAMSSDPLKSLLDRCNLCAIAAMAQNRVIGQHHKIPWNIPEEMAFFRKTTTGSTVLMGRKTFESIGHPLPNRKHIVLTRDPQWTFPEVTVIHDPIDLLSFEKKPTIWVCGGEKIYQLLLPYCREIYLSTVHRSYDGDTFFPEIPDSFSLKDTIFTCQTFEINHYQNKNIE